MWDLTSTSAFVIYPPYVGYFSSQCETEVLYISFWASEESLGNKHYSPRD